MKDNHFKELFNVCEQNKNRNSPKTDYDMDL
jgi:hypothetical protein